MALKREALLATLRGAEARGLTAREVVQCLGAPRSRITAVRAMLAGLERRGVVTRRGGRYALREEASEARPRGAARGRRPAPEAPPEARSRSPRFGPGARGRGGLGASRRPGRRSPARGARAPDGAPAERLGIVVPGRRGGVIRPYPDDGSFVVHGTGGHAPGSVVSLRPGGRQGLVPDAILGRAGDPDVDFAALAAAHGIPDVFPPDCEAEARAVASLPPGREAQPRVDLGARPLVTIDPASARDHDDAVEAWAEPEGGYGLRVAIADVAHYVAEGGALDAEARRRGNSIYFPDRAVPMLPERLSAGLCSLRPEEERLAWVVELRFAADAAVRSARVLPARMRSRARLVYEEAAAMLAGEARHPDAQVQASLETLGELSGRLTARRLREGSLDLELPETRLVLGPEGRPVGASPVARTPAHRAVEEAMLAANRAVARLLDAAHQPALYRVHEAPDPEELAQAADAVAEFGEAGRRAARHLEAGHVNRALALFDPKRPETRGVHLLVLRAMKQARYAARNTGHYALAFEDYTHFTSPIRRYADLVVHRAVKAHLEGRRTHGAGLARLALHLSGQERAAMAAERQMHALKTAVLMEGRRGEVDEGIVSGVIRAGLFVTLRGTGIDGFVPARELGREVHFDERRRSLSMRRPRRRLRLGDRLRVAVADVDLARGRVRLTPAEDAQTSSRASSSAARRSHSR